MGERKAIYEQVTDRHPPNHTRVIRAVWTTVDNGARSAAPSTLG
jgi:hypothetical protein